MGALLRGQSCSGQLSLADQLGGAGSQSAVTEPKIPPSGQAAGAASAEVAVAQEQGGHQGPQVEEEPCPAGADLDPDSGPRADHLVCLAGPKTHIFLVTVVLAPDLITVLGAPGFHTGS